MKPNLPRISIVLIFLLCLGVAPITNIQHGIRNNERKNVLYGINIFNNTSLMPSINKSPSFDPVTTSANITVLQDEDAFLVCAVLNQEKNFVSWLRHSDVVSSINLVSVGTLKYIQDPRYHIFHNQQNNTWTLKIRKAKKEDEGFFECQISTAPPVGHTIYLNVIEHPELNMIGGNDDRFARAGSNFNLTCFISQIRSDTKVFKWSHNDQEINHQTPRGGVLIITEHNVAAVSHLMIKNLTMADSGQYSCTASAKSRANVMLHVINDDEANMPESSSSNSKGTINSLKFYILYLYYIVTTIT